MTVTDETEPTELPDQPPPRVRVAGIDLDAMHEAEAVEHVLSSFQSGRGGRAIFVNVDVALQVRRHPELTQIAQSADLVLADGMPLIWAARLQNTAIPERVAGSTVLCRLVDRAAREGVPVMLLGGRPGAAQDAVGLLGSLHPGLRAGFHTPPFGFEDDPAAVTALQEAVDSFGRCICFVGLGFPKQERVMESLAARRPDWWFVASGGGIDFLAEGRRAPGWMQRTGLEWLYRLGREPKRLGRRYLVDDLPFAAGVLLSSAWRGARRTDRRGEPRAAETGNGVG